ncbi:TRAP transporter small permease [Pannonibacter sp.]|uniref:TRAP transporter small permease n=1 Tax=Pannonibacter sp. TaxID=1906786 RepID=UPI003F707E2E
MLELVLTGTAGAMLLALTLVTCIDVVARYWFNRPLAGAYELTEVLLSALIFVALPVTTARREHVDVDLVEMFAGKPLRAFMHRLADLLCGLVLGLFAWRVFVHAVSLQNDGAVTDSLSLPLAPLGYLAAAACAVSSLICLLRLRLPYQS